MIKNLAIALLSILLIAGCAEEQEKPDEFNQLAREYLSSDLNLAKEYAKKALIESSSSSSEFDSYFILGYIENKEGNVKLAIAHYVEALELYAYDVRAVGVYENLGLIFKNLGNYERAIQYHKIGLELAETERKIDFYHLLGKSYVSIEDFNIAQKYYLRAIEFSKEFNNQKQLAVSFNLLGLLEKKKGDFDLAQKYYNKVIELKSLDTYNDRAGIAYHNLGNIYLEQENFEEALSYFKKAVEIKERESSKFYSEMDLGECYFKLNDLKKAENHWDNAIGLLGHIANKTPNHLKIYNHLKELNQAKNNHVKALEYADKYNEETMSYFQLRDESLQSNTIAAFESYADLYGDGLVKEKAIKKWFLSTWAVSIGTILLIIALVLIWRMVARRRSTMQVELMELVEEL